MEQLYRRDYYTHAKPTPNVRKVGASKALAIDTPKKKLMLYVEIDGFVEPFGVAFCYGDVTHYYDWTTRGRIANRRDLPGHYVDRFPQRVMQELAGVDRYTRVYAKRTV